MRRKTRHQLRRARQRGFSLIEALAAATLLATAMMALNMTSISLARGAKTADGYSAATALATERLEILRAMPLGAPGHTPGNYSSANNPLTADGQPGGRYTLTWVVSPKDTPAIGLKTVTVNVAWTDATAHTMQLAGYVRCSAVPCP
jgi:prepilin-type N-terminal cleavage/methylation domain-containing protein